MTRERRTILGLGSVVVGALLGMLALTALPWFRSTLGGVLNFGSRPGQLRQTIGLYEKIPEAAISFWVSPVFFRWLGLVLLLVAAIAAAATVGFDPAPSRVTGVAASVVALAGLVLTALAVKIVNVDSSKLPDTRATPPGYLDYLGATGVGAWAMALAFVLIGAGALLAAGGRDSFRALLSDEIFETDENPESDESGEPPVPAAAPAPEPAPEPEPVEPRRDDW